MLNVEIYDTTTSAFVNVNEYIIGIDGIPYIFHNEDTSVILESFKVKVSHNFPYTIDRFTEMKFYESSTLLYHGYINNYTYFYDSLEYEIEIYSLLNRLNDYFVDEETLATPLIANGAETVFGKYWYCNLGSYDPTATAHVGVLHALSVMFDIAGFSLDYSAIADVEYTNETYGAGAYTLSVPYKGLYLGKDQMYCLGNNIACRHNRIDSVWDSVLLKSRSYYQNKITFLEFFNEVLLQLQLKIISTGIKSYSLYIHDNTKYTVTDDNKWGYEVTREYPEVDNTTKVGYYTSISYKKWNNVHAQPIILILDHESYWQETQDIPCDIFDFGRGKKEDTGNSIIIIPNFVILYNNYEQLSDLSLDDSLFFENHITYAGSDNLYNPSGAYTRIKPNLGNKITEVIRTQVTTDIKPVLKNIIMYDTANQIPYSEITQISYT